MIRFWGTLGVILSFASGSQHEYAWLHLMQGIFDPSQGLFNFILFVALSNEEIERIKGYFNLSKCRGA